MIENAGGVRTPMITLRPRAPTRIAALISTGQRCWEALTLGVSRLDSAKC